MSAPDAALRDLFIAELKEHAVPIDAFLKRGLTPEGEDAPEDVRRALHSIKGAARVMDAGSLSELVQASEGCLAHWPDLKPAQAQAAFELFAELVAYLKRVAAAKEPVAFIAQSAVEQKALRIAFERVAAGKPPAGLSGATTVNRESRAPLLDASLLEIFRTEVAECVKVLSDGLVVLDTEAPSPALWEQLMRSAHSLKGAARIVKLNGVAQVAHSLEDCFVLAQGGSVTLTSSDIDVLLQAVDSVKRAASLICDDVEGGRAEAEAAAVTTTSRLAELLGGSTPADRQAAQDLALMRTQIGSSLGTSIGPSPVSRDHTVLSVPPFALKNSTTIEPAISFPPPTLSSKPPAPVASRPPTTLGTRIEPAREAKLGSERVLRVDAESINALVGLAGESLVESRRVTSFVQNLARVKKHETVLIDLIDDIESLLSASLEGNGVLKHLVHDAKLQARECARLLGEHGSSIDGYVRRAEELGERLYREALKSRMRPFADGTHGFPRAVRDLARDLGKRAKLEIAGQHTEVDRDALENLDAPIHHLLRNALDHGIENPEARAAAGKPEMALVRIEARHHAGMLSIVVSDDGRGIDVEKIRLKVVDRGLAPAALATTLTRAELLDFLFLPGFSTANAVSEISGRGVGLDVVKSSVEALGGGVRITSELGKGTAFHLQLPVTRSVIRAVVAEIAGEAYAFPLLRIDRIDRLPLSRVKTLENRQYILIDDKPVSLISARHLFGVPPNTTEREELNVVVVSDRKHCFGIVVDEFRGEHDLVVRPLDARLGKIPEIAAAAILTNGAAALIVDVDDMVRSVDRMVQGGRVGNVTGIGLKKLTTRRRVLVVDDSITVREAQRQVLVNRGYDVDVAVDGVEGFGFARNTPYDLVITDIDMPRMNGIDLVKSIKLEPQLKNIPVIIVSYKDRDEDRLRGLEAGANYYLTKSSFHDDKLVEAVQDLIGDATS